MSYYPGLEGRVHYTLVVYLLAQAAAPPEIPKDPKLYIYDAKLDAAGQKVESAAGAIANGAIFETQLENLKIISQREMERIFASQRRAALARVEAARNWGAVLEDVGDIRKVVRDAADPSEWALKSQELKKQLDGLPQLPGANESSAAAPGEFLVELGRSQALQQVMKALADKQIASKNEMRIVKRLQDGVAAVGQNLKDLAAMPLAAGSRSAQQRMKVSLIQAEMDYWRSVGMIEARRQAGQNEVEKLLQGVEGSIACDQQGKCSLTFEDDDANKTSEPLDTSEKIEATLVRYQGQPQKLEQVVGLLQQYAALAARAETPFRIARLREAIEERRFDIRKDAIFAKTYEEIFLLGAQRLALYGKGGVKPEALAAFLQAAMTAGLIPAVSLR